MATERSFSTPLLVGSALLLLALILLLTVVPLAACPWCSDWENVVTSAASPNGCSVCQGKRKVPWLKQVRIRHTRL